MQHDSIELQTVGTTNQNELVYAALGLTVAVVVVLTIVQFLGNRSSDQTRRKP